MATIRTEKNRNNPYVMINKTALDDEKLSWKAKGIWCYLMSKPDGWKCQVEDLKKHSKDGTDSVKAGLRELREHGYMIKRPIKNDKNIIVEWEEILFEVPADEAKEIFANQEIKRIASLEKRRNKKSINGKSVSGEKSINGKSTSGFSSSGKPNCIINNKILSTNLSTNEISSSKLKAESNNLIDYFNENICELKKTTRVKFEKFIKNKSIEFVKALIDYQTEIGTRSYAGFAKAIDNFKDLETVEELNAAIEKFRANKKQKAEFANKTKKSNKNKVTTFEETKEQQLQSYNDVVEDDFNNLTL